MVRRQCGHSVDDTDHVGCADNAESTPVIPDAADVGSIFEPATFVVCVPRAVPRLIPTTTCCETIEPDVTATPSVKRRSLNRTAAPGTIVAAAASIPSAAAERTAALYLAIRQSLPYGFLRIAVAAFHSDEISTGPSTLPDALKSGKI